jgi:hypothetical protein
MRFRRALRQLIAILAMGLGASNAGAGMLTFAMSGTVGTSFRHAAGRRRLHAHLHGGTPRLPGNLIFSKRGNHLGVVRQRRIRDIDHGQLVGPSSLGLTRQIDDPAADSYEMFSSGAVADAPGRRTGTFWFFTLQIIDPTAAMVPDAFTPISNLSPFGNKRGIRVVFANDVTAIAVGATIESIALVPEPGTLMLLTVGCGVLIGGRRLGARRGPVLRRC